MRNIVAIVVLLSSLCYGQAGPVVKSGIKVKSGWKLATTVLCQTPTYTSVDVSSGSYLGGTAVVITGTGFVDGATVTYGGSPASVTFVSSTTLNTTTPGHAAGAVDIVITNPGTPGTCTATGSGAFTYTGSGTIYVNWLASDESVGNCGATVGPFGWEHSASGTCAIVAAGSCVSGNQCVQLGSSTTTGAYSDLAWYTTGSPMPVNPTMTNGSDPNGGVWILLKDVAVNADTDSRCSSGSAQEKYLRKSDGSAPIASEWVDAIFGSAGGCQAGHSLCHQDDPTTGNIFDNGLATALTTPQSFLLHYRDDGVDGHVDIWGCAGVGCSPKAGTHIISGVSDSRLGSHNASTPWNPALGNIYTQDCSSGTNKTETGGVEICDYDCS